MRYKLIYVYSFYFTIIDKVIPNNIVNMHHTSL